MESSVSDDEGVDELIKKFSMALMKKIRQVFREVFAGAWDGEGNSYMLLVQSTGSH